VSIGKGFRKGCSLSPILFTSYIECHTKEAVEGFRDFKIGQVFLTMKYADNLVLSEEEAVLQGMPERLIDAGICYGMKMNLEKTKVMRISRQPSPVESAINTKKN
jgi:hypothetical protein